MFELLLAVFGGPFRRSLALCVVGVPSEVTENVERLEVRSPVLVVAVQPKYPQFWAMLECCCRATINLRLARVGCACVGRALRRGC